MRSAMEHGHGHGLVAAHWHLANAEVDDDQGCSHFLIQIRTARPGAEYIKGFLSYFNRLEH